jgi:hypothetical protein
MKLKCTKIAIIETIGCVLSTFFKISFADNYQKKDIKTSKYIHTSSF